VVLFDRQQRVFSRDGWSSDEQDEEGALYFRPSFREDDTSGLSPLLMIEETRFLLKKEKETLDPSATSSSI